MGIPVSKLLASDNIGTTLRTSINAIIDSFSGFTFDGSGNLILAKGLSCSGFDAKSISTADISIMLNSAESGSGVGSGSGIASIIINRGLLANAILFWDETTAQWEVKLGSGTATPISLSGHTHSDYLKKDGTVALTGPLNLNNKNISNNGNSGSGIFIDNSGNVSVTGDIIGSGSIKTESGIKIYNPGKGDLEDVILAFDSDTFIIKSEKTSSGTKRARGYSDGAGTLKEFVYSQTLGSGSGFTLPAISNGGFGKIITGSGDQHADFFVSAAGFVTLGNPTTDLIANSGYSGKICIGESGSGANPITIRNLYGSSGANINLILHYS